MSVKEIIFFRGERKVFCASQNLGLLKFLGYLSNSLCFIHPVFHDMGSRRTIEIKLSLFFRGRTRTEQSQLLFSPGHISYSGSECTERLHRRCHTADRKKQRSNIKRNIKQNQNIVEKHPRYNLTKLCIYYACITLERYVTIE